MKTIFNTLKVYIYAIVGGIIALLFGLLKLEKHKVKGLKEQLKDAKNDIEIKDFEATEAKIEMDTKDEDIKPSSNITI